LSTELITPRPARINFACREGLPQPLSVLVLHENERQNRVFYEVSHLLTS
jgi:hypothetical protein